MVIGFLDDDYEGISWPHNDALMVTLTIANHNVHRILVDNGSSVDLLYWSAFEKLKLSRDKIISVHFSLMGFKGEWVHSLGSIELLLTARAIPKQVTIMVKIILIDCPSAYNAIVGRMVLNRLIAISSTPLLKMILPIESGVGEVKGDQWVA